MRLFNLTYYKMKRTILFFYLLNLLSPIHSQNVSINKNIFVVEGKQIWFNGINTPWHYFNDFGGHFNYSWWNNEFQKYADNKINLVRIWIHCSGLLSPTVNDSGYVTGVNAQFWTDMDSLIAISKSKKIYILPSLWSFEMVKNTQSTYKKYRNLLKNQKNIISYVDNFLIPLVKRYNNEPYILGWEICNEPEWIFEKEEDGMFPRQSVQLLHALCASAIHKNSNKPVTTGASSVKWNSDIYTTDAGPNAGNCWSDSALQLVYNDPKAYLDFYQIHWYPWQTKYFSSPYQHTTSYWKISDRPVIIGETQGLDACDPFICQTLVQMYENAYLNGFNGVCGWKTPQNDGLGLIENICVATNAFYKNHPQLVYPVGNALK